jgi:hypothetical protein
MAATAERTRLLAALLRVAIARPRFTYAWLRRHDRPLLQHLRTWSRDIVIAELRRHGPRGVAGPLKHACERLFGSISDARKAAGALSPPWTWTSESPGGAYKHRLGVLCQASFGRGAQVIRIEFWRCAPEACQTDQVIVANA